MRAGGQPGLALLDQTDERVAAKVSTVLAAALAAGRDPGALRYQINVLSLHVTDVPGTRPWVSSMAAA